ncbi:MAG: DUF433 domain-containing protein [Candidatus Saliniplasma sp.]
MPKTVEKKSYKKEENKIMKDPNIMGGSTRIEVTRIRVSDIAVDHEYRDRKPGEIADIQEREKKGKRTVK